LNNKIKEALESKKECPPELIDNLLKYGVLTGSYVFGGFVKGKSDIDIILKPEHYNYDEYDPYHIFLSGSVDDEHECAYVKTKDGVFNVLLIESDKRRRCWVKATKIMLKIKKIPSMAKAFKLKQNRITQMGALRAIIGEYE